MYILRFFTGVPIAIIGWGSGRIKEQELLDEYRWMEQLATAGKSYYSINEVKPVTHTHTHTHMHMHMHMHTHTYTHDNLHSHTLTH